MSNTDAQTDAVAAGLSSALSHLTQTLGAEGWRVRRSRNAIRARRGLVSVSLKPRPSDDGVLWRARFNDGFPRFTVLERQSSDPVESLEPVVTRALAVARFFDGSTALMRNPSKSWLGYRVWEAVRPVDS